MDAINEIERTQRTDRLKIRSDAELLLLLTQHKGWTTYVALVETVAQNYHSAIMKPVENILEATKGEFAKGVLNGLSLATALPNLKIKEASELRGEVEGEE